MAWGQDYLLSNDPKTAAEYFKRAVEKFPQLWQTLGRLETQTGNQAAAISSFQRSVEYLSGSLRNAPSNERIRTEYAQVLMNVGRLDDARVVLEQGRMLNPDGPWAWLLASLSVNYHDLMANQGKPLSELLGYLDRALTSDPNHGGALNRLMSYATAKVDGNIELRTVLSRVIAEGEQPALAHLAMGNLCWIENLRDQAMFHFERAMEIRSDMTALLNNMAWLIANDPKNPDLDRAMALITSALKTRPDDASFLDTRGTIYFLQEDWRSALADLEQALSGVRDKSAVHKKLAIIYDKLKLPEIAEQHRLLGQSITPKESP